MGARRPGRWDAAKAVAYQAIEREVRLGNQLTFNRNDRTTGRVYGGQVAVVELDAPDRSVVVADAHGVRQTLMLAAAADQHWRHGYAQTMHGAQERTAWRVMAPAESGRANLMDQRSIYVGLSRAKAEARVYAHARDRLVARLSVG